MTDPTLTGSRRCPECGTAIMDNGFGAHHSAVCKMEGVNFNMTDPTLTQALATPCKRCGGMPEQRMEGRFYTVGCRDCIVAASSIKSYESSARQWVEMNKEVDGEKT